MFRASGGSLEEGARERLFATVYGGAHDGMPQRGEPRAASARDFGDEAAQVEAVHNDGQGSGYR